MSVFNSMYQNQIPQRYFVSLYEFNGIFDLDGNFITACLADDKVGATVLI